MKKTLLGSLFTICAVAASAQTLSPKVNPSAGGYATGNNGISLSFTIGETLTPTLAASAGMLSQGQQQPEIDLRTGTVVGNLCPGGSVTVHFTSTGYVAAANVFTLQLSDAGGNFAAPVVLGTTGGTMSGSIAVVVPNGSYPGSGYRVRVVGSQPYFEGTSLPIAACTCGLPIARCKPAAASLNAAGQATVTISDIDDGSTFGCGLQATSLSLTAVTCANLGPNTVTLTVTDVHNQFSSCMSVVTVTDPLLPSISCPGPFTVTCSSSVPTPNPATLTASDNCGVPVKTHVGDATSNMTCTNRKTVTRTYRATDGSGNSATCSQVITVFDNVKPNFTSVSANVTVQCNSIPAVGSPTASDGCGGVVTIAYNGQTQTNSNCSDSYTLTRQWTATDACGNTKTATQRINVIDTQKPNFTTTPANVTVQCDAIPEPANPTATDNCDAAVAVTYNGQTQTNGACANAYTLTRRWTAADNCGNTKTVTQRIVVVDNIKPVFTSLPANTSMSCHETPPAVGTPTASDGCGTATVTYLGQTTVSGNCPGNYEIRRTWRATDVCGNSTAATQTIQVSDTGAPVFTSTPGPITIECGDPLPPLVNPTASDACGGYAAVTFLGNMPSGSGCAADYTVTRTWEAEDLCGNTVSVSQVITVQSNNNAEEEGAQNRGERATATLNSKFKIQNSKFKSLNLQPNPTTDRVWLDLTDFAGEAVTVSIFSDVGQLIWENRIKPVQDFNLQISLREAGATAGIYTISVCSAGGVVAKRAVLVE